MAQMVKSPLAVQETRVQSLGRDDTLQEGMATHSGILAWRIPWTEKPGGLWSPCSRIGLDTTERLTLAHTQSSFQKHLFKKTTSKVPLGTKIQNLRGGLWAHSGSVTSF